MASGGAEPGTTTAHGAAQGAVGVGSSSAPRHAEPDGLADVADLETVTSTPVPDATRRDLPVCRATSPEIAVPVAGEPAVPEPAVPERATAGPATPATPAAPVSAVGAARSRTRWRSWVLGAAAVLVVLTGAGSVAVLVTGALSSREAVPPSPWAQASAAAAPAAPMAPTPLPAPAVTPAGRIGAVMVGDGRRVVGVDLVPGTYRSAGPLSGEGDCSWSRRTTSSRGAEAVVASGVPQGPATVTVRRGDTAFVTRGCAAWTRQP